MNFQIVVFSIVAAMLTIETAQAQNQNMQPTQHKARLQQLEKLK